MTISEVMSKIAEKQQQVVVKQAEIAEIAKEIAVLEEQELGVKPGKNLGLAEMVNLIQKVMKEALVVTGEKTVN